VRSTEIYGLRKPLQNKKVAIRPKTKVTVAEWLDGSIHILFEIPYGELNPQILQKVRMGRRLAEYVSMNT
jgi:hypothetical protein